MNKIIYVDMDGVLCDYNAEYDRIKLINPNIKFPQSLPNFFENLKPLKGAIDTFKYLQEHFIVYILTAPSIFNPLSYTGKRNWVEKNLGFDTLNNLILSPHKELLKGDYIIDDMETGKGQDKFEGNLIKFGSEKFKDWKAIKKYFKKILDINKNKPFIYKRYSRLSS